MFEGERGKREKQAKGKREKGKGERLPRAPQGWSMRNHNVPLPETASGIFSLLDTGSIDVLSVYLCVVMYNYAIQVLSNFDGI